MSHFLNGNQNSSNVFLTQAANAGESLPTMEQIKDVSIVQPLLSGQVLIYNGSIWQNIIPQSVVNDILGSLLDVNISSLQNAQYLSYSSTLQKWINTNISESNVTNLVNDLSLCEKLSNKNTSNGYCGLNNGLINVVNIPNLPESLIINLTSDLLNKADLISGYLKSSEIPLSVPLTINTVTTTNNIINLTTDNITQGTINKYMTLPILESNVTNLTNDLNNKADLVSGYLKSSEIPLIVPLTINSLSTSNNILNLTTDNIPQGSTNNYAVYPIPISDISSFTITNPSTGQFLYYNGSQWINQNISEINVSNLTSDLLSCEKTINKNSANGYCPLDQNKLVPNSNIPQLSFSNLTNIFNIVSPANNQILYYNSSVGLFENTLINSSFLSDFNISSASSNQVLQYSNGKWINATLNFTSTLSGDSDI